MEGPFGGYSGAHRNPDNSSLQTGFIKWRGGGGFINHSCGLLKCTLAGCRPPVEGRLSRGCTSGDEGDVLGVDEVARRVLGGQVVRGAQF